MRIKGRRKILDALARDRGLGDDWRLKIWRFRDLERSRNGHPGEEGSKVGYFQICLDEGHL